MGKAEFKAISYRAICKFKAYCGTLARAFVAEAQFC